MSDPVVIFPDLPIGSDSPVIRLNRERLFWLAGAVALYTGAVKHPSQSVLDEAAKAAADVFDRPTSAEVARLDEGFVDVCSAVFLYASHWMELPGQDANRAVADSIGEESVGTLKAEGDEVFQINRTTLEHLLGAVLDVLSMSLPNKQQHESAQHTVRKAFDAAYADMLKLTHPGVGYAMSGGYAVNPLR
jgi:hypothetical protein